MACSGGERLRSPRYKTQYGQINCAFNVSKRNLKNMSNSIGHNLIHQNLLAPAVLEHQTTYRKFNHDGNTKLQVVVSAPTSGFVSEIDMQITTTSGTLVLHWGGIQNGKDLWIMSLHSSEAAQNKKFIAYGLKIL
ncbi:hypothetical protein ACSBR1_013356 [Camellia fascicularis]